MLRSQRLGLGRGGFKPVSLVHSWWKRYFGFERTKSVLGVGWLRLPRAVKRHTSYCSLRPSLMLHVCRTVRDHKPLTRVAYWLQGFGSAVGMTVDSLLFVSRQFLYRPTSSNSARP